MRKSHSQVLSLAQFARLFLAGFVFVVAGQLQLLRAQTPPTPAASPAAVTPTPQATTATTTSIASTTATPTATKLPTPPTPPTTPDVSPYAIDPVTLTVPYQQIRNPNSVTQVTDKPLALKITYTGKLPGPKYIQVKVTYKIHGLEGHYTFDGVYGLKDGAYTLDSGLEGFLTALFAQESELLPKDFEPVRPLKVKITDFKIIPMDITVDPVTGQPSSVTTATPDGCSPSNTLSIVLKQVLGSQSANPAGKAPATTTPPAAPVPQAAKKK